MRNIYIIAVLLSILTISCGDMSEEITWDVDEIPPRLVVEGSVTSELKHQQIRLTRSDNYFSNTESAAVSGANVNVSDGTTTYDFAENPAGSGNYESITAFAGIPGNTYTLNIELPSPLNNEINFSAISELKEGFRFDSLVVEIFENPFSFDDEDTVMTVFIMFGQEPEATHDYYLVNLYRNNELVTDTIDKAFVLDDEIYGINGEQIIPLYIGEEYLPGDTAGIELLSVSRQYADFLTGVNSISRGTDPLGFSGPPANAIGNIEGGDAFGFFIASDVIRSDRIIDTLITFE